MRDDDLYRTWGERLRRRRQELGLTQVGLAAAAGTSSAHVSNIEVGRTSVSDDLRMSLAAALQVRVEDLFPYPEDLVPAAAQ